MPSMNGIQLVEKVTLFVTWRSSGKVIARLVSEAVLATSLTFENLKISFSRLFYKRKRQLPIPVGESDIFCSFAPL
jgi:hypothetical protein